MAGFVLRPPQYEDLETAAREQFKLGAGRDITEEEFAELMLMLQPSEDADLVARMVARQLRPGIMSGRVRIRHQDGDFQFGEEESDDA